MKNKSYLAGFILNLLIAVLASVGLILQLCLSKSGSIFVYYTILSNTLCIIISLTLSVFLGINCFVKEVKIPLIISLIKYINEVMLIVTFLTVVLVLSWSSGMSLFELLFTGSMLYHHTLVPLISIVSFVFYEKHDLKRFWYTFLPAGVTLTYGIVFIILDLARVMDAPYHFLRFSTQPLYFTLPTMLGVLIVTYGISFLIRLLNQKFSTVR